MGRSVIAALCACLVTLVVGVPTAHAQIFHEQIRIPIDLALRLGGREQVDIKNSQAVAAVTVVIRWSSNMAGDHEIVLRNEVGAVVHRFKKSDSAAGFDVSQPFKAGRYFTAELLGRVGDAEKPIILSYRTRQKKGLNPESGSIFCSVDSNGCSSEGLVSVPNTAVQKAAPSVARLRLGKASCTGFLIDHDILLTNFHCLEPSHNESEYWKNVFESKREIRGSACKDITVEFDVYDKPGAPRKWLCQSVAAFSPTEQLDYVAFKVSPVDTGEKRVTLKPAAHVAGKWNLFILQHPLGSPMMVSGLCAPVEAVNASTKDALQKWNAVVDKCLPGVTLPKERVEKISDAKLARSIYYGMQCSTESGSSGSPVIDAPTGAVVALHYAGESFYDTPVAMFGAERGAKFKACLDQERTKQKLNVFNKAVPICAIAADLATQIKRPALKCT